MLLAGRSNLQHVGGRVGGLFSGARRGEGGFRAGFLAPRGCYQQDDAPGDNGDANCTGKGQG